MILLDTNILIYAAHAGGAHHARTTAWLQGTIADHQVLGVPWVTILGFIRISTNPRVFPSPFTGDEACTVVTVLMSHPAVSVVEPTPRHLSVLTGLLRDSGTAGNLTTDAHIATLALEHRAKVASFDRDLGRFGVEVVVPG